MNVTTWLTAAGSLLLGLLGEWRYRRLPELRETPATGPLPSLSVIVPARNEAANLPRLLASLRASAYPGPCELIVVDDGSTDGTGPRAEAGGARVLRLDHLPPGWLGKPRACHRGAESARGDWLLFTDADTVHAPGAATNAVAWALAQNLDGLSLFPGHERGAPADRLVLAAAFAGYFAGMRTAGLLNGQYILLRRQVYERSGGFAAVRDQPLEDLALGHRLHAQGYRVPVLRGERLLRVRMYTDLGQMWHGFTRLAALSLRWSGPGSLLTALFTVCTAAPLGALVRSLLAGSGRRRALLLWLAACLGVIPWMRRFDALPWTPLTPLGATFVQASAIWGLLTRLSGLPIRWKDRPL
jgi:chlorobactene glucosyltransferase